MANDQNNENKLAPTSQALDILERSLQTGSLDSLLREDEVVFLLIDVSSSMNTAVDRNGTPDMQWSNPKYPGPALKKCHHALAEVVKEVQNAGYVPMISFGDGTVKFVDDVPECAGGTPLHLAIKFAKQYGGTRLVIISDGMPDLVDDTLEAAKEFGGQIDVVYAGAARDPEMSAFYGRDGEKFLEQLAILTGGKRVTHSFGEVKALAAGVIGLLSAGDAPPTVIQGPGFTTVPDAVPDEPEDDEEDDDDDEDGDDDDDE